MYSAVVYCNKMTIFFIEETLPASINYSLKDEFLAVKVHTINK